jgi:hypothetical protein
VKTPDRGGEREMTKKRERQMEMKAVGNNVRRVLIAAFVIPLFIASGARAEQKYLVKVGVFEDIRVCPLYLPNPCEAAPVGPIKGVRVTFRTSTGKLQGRVRTARDGIARFRLPNGEYVASINLPGYRQRFIVDNRKPEMVVMSIGKAKVKDYGLIGHRGRSSVPISPVPISPVRVQSIPVFATIDGLLRLNRGREDGDFY